MTVSPGALLLMVNRSEPAGPGEGPSLLFNTVRVAGAKRSSRTSSQSLAHGLECTSRGPPLFLRGWQRGMGFIAFCIQERMVMEPVLVWNAPANDQHHARAADRRDLTHVVGTVTQRKEIALPISTA